MSRRAFCDKSTLGIVPLLASLVMLLSSSVCHAGKSAQAANAMSVCSQTGFQASASYISGQYQEVVGSSSSVQYNITDVRFKVEIDPWSPAHDANVLCFAELRIRPESCAMYQLLEDPVFPSAVYDTRVGRSQITECRLPASWNKLSQTQEWPFVEFTGSGSSGYRIDFPKSYKGLQEVMNLYNKVARLMSTSDSTIANPKAEKLRALQWSSPKRVVHFDGNVDAQDLQVRHRDGVTRSHKLIHDMYERRHPVARWTVMSTENSKSGDSQGQFELHRREVLYRHVGSEPSERFKTLKKKPKPTPPPPPPPPASELDITFSDSLEWKLSIFRASSKGIVGSLGIDILANPRLEARTCGGDRDSDSCTDDGAKKARELTFITVVSRLWSLSDPATTGGRLLEKQLASEEKQVLPMKIQEYIVKTADKRILEEPVNPENDFVYGTTDDDQITARTSKSKNNEELDSSSSTSKYYHTTHTVMQADSLDLSFKLGKPLVLGDSSNGVTFMFSSGVETTGDPSAESDGKTPFTLFAYIGIACELRFNGKGVTLLGSKDSKDKIGFLMDAEALFSGKPSKPKLHFQGVYSSPATSSLPDGASSKMEGQGEEITPKVCSKPSLSHSDAALVATFTPGLTKEPLKWGKPDGRKPAEKVLVWVRLPFVFLGIPMELNAYLSASLEFGLFLDPCLSFDNSASLSAGVYVKASVTVEADLLISVWVVKGGVYGSLALATFTTDVAAGVRFDDITNINTNTVSACLGIRPAITFLSGELGFKGSVIGVGERRLAVVSWSGIDYKYNLDLGGYSCSPTEFQNVPGENQIVSQTPSSSSGLTYEEALAMLGPPHMCGRIWRIHRGDFTVLIRRQLINGQTVGKRWLVSDDSRYGWTTPKKWVEFTSKEFPQSSLTFLKSLMGVLESNQGTSSTVLNDVASCDLVGESESIGQLLHASFEPPIVLYTSGTGIELGKEPKELIFGPYNNVTGPGGVPAVQLYITCDLSGGQIHWHTHFIESHDIALELTRQQFFESRQVLTHPEKLVLKEKQSSSYTDSVLPGDSSLNLMARLVQLIKKTGDNGRKDVLNFVESLPDVEGVVEEHQAGRWREQPCRKHFVVRMLPWTRPIYVAYYLNSWRYAIAPVDFHPFTWGGPAEDPARALDWQLGIHLQHDGKLTMGELATLSSIFRKNNPKTYNRLCQFDGLSTAKKYFWWGMHTQSHVIAHTNPYNNKKDEKTPVTCFANQFSALQFHINKKNGAWTSHDYPVKVHHQRYPGEFLRIWVTAGTEPVEDEMQRNVKQYGVVSTPTSTWMVRLYPPPWKSDHNNEMIYTYNPEEWRPVADWPFIVDCQFWTDHSRWVFEQLMWYLKEGRKKDTEYHTYLKDVENAKKCSKCRLLDYAHLDEDNALGKVSSTFSTHVGHNMQCPDPLRRFSLESTRYHVQYEEELHDLESTSPSPYVLPGTTPCWPYPCGSRKACDELISIVEDANDELEDPSSSYLKPVIYIPVLAVAGAVLIAVALLLVLLWTRSKRNRSPTRSSTPAMSHQEVKEDPVSSAVTSSDVTGEASDPKHIRMSVISNPAPSTTGQDTESGSA